MVLITAIPLSLLCIPLLLACPVIYSQNDMQYQTLWQPNINRQSGIFRKCVFLKDLYSEFPLYYTQENSNGLKSILHAHPRSKVMSETTSAWWDDTARVGNQKRSVHFTREQFSFETSHKNALLNFWWGIVRLALANTYENSTCNNLRGKCPEGKPFSQLKESCFPFPYSRWLVVIFHSCTMV